MSALSVQVPFPVFQDRDGQPLDNGYVWIGTANLNPQTNPITVYYDSALTIVAAQPLRTINGYVSRSGSPAQIYVDGVNFSILVQDSKGSMIYNFADGTGISPNASGVVYGPAGAGSVPTTVQAKLRESVSVKDFGAVGNGVADDTAAIQAAIDYVKVSGGAMYLPTGTYNITDTLIIDTGVYITGVILFGDGRNTIISQTGINKDAIHFSTTQFLQNSGLRDLQIVCGLTAGHCINIVYGCTTCFLTNVDLVSLNVAKAVVYGDWTTFGGGVFDTKFSGGSWYLNPASTEAGVRIMTRSTIFNENVFENLRVYQSDTLAFFHITAVAGSQYWLYNNTWKNINFEICKGGGFHFSSANRYTVENCSFWDSDGPYKNNLINFAAGSGYESIGNTLIGVGRNGDTLGAFVNDIRLVAGQDTVLINCYTQSGDSPKYDLGNKRVTVIGKLFGTIVNTVGLTAINSIDGYRFPAIINGASLSYYDEGNWIATLTGTVAPPTTPITISARWTRIGREVLVEGVFQNVDLSGASGGVLITGLPFPVNAAIPGSGTAGTLGLGTAPSISIAPALNSYIQLVDAVTLANIAVVPSTGKFIYFSLKYTV